MTEYRDFLELVYHIPVTGEKPLSVLLVGTPGTGKSHLLCSYRASNCMYLTDTTAAGLETMLAKFAGSGELAYIVIPDLITAMSRKAKRLTSFLNAALEEGVKAIVRKDVDWKAKDGQPVNIGCIGAITTGEFRLHYRMLRSTGFLSRSYLVNFNPDVDEIAMMMARGEKGTSHEIQIPSEKVVIPIREEASKAIYNEGRVWAAEEREEKLRKIGMLMRLAKAHAYLRNDKGNGPLEVLIDDVNGVLEILRCTRFKRPVYQGGLFGS